MGHRAREVRERLHRQLNVVRTEVAGRHDRPPLSPCDEFMRGTRHVPPARLRKRRA